jgi:hypothetical protein
VFRPERCRQGSCAARHEAAVPCGRRIGRRASGARRRITATKTAFDIPPIDSGTQTLELRNESGEDREWNLTVYAPGKTSKDFDAWANGGLKGEPPATFYGAMQSIPTGTSVFLTLELESGTTYALEDLEAGLRTEIEPT